MNGIPGLSYTEIIKALQVAGFIVIRQQGGEDGRLFLADNFVKK
ncbi:MAG TPA: hypothetical protein VI935_04100 [Thermodesulfobacteriota bacterium]|nr:hypothetical protein [Thermodesulfobacteriota bacterium]